MSVVSWGQGLPSAGNRLSSVSWSLSMHLTLHMGWYLRMGLYRLAVVGVAGKPTPGIDQGRQHSQTQGTLAGVLLGRYCCYRVEDCPPLGCSIVRPDCSFLFLYHFVAVVFFFPTSLSYVIGDSNGAGMTQSGYSGASELSDRDTFSHTGKCVTVRNQVPGTLT